MDDDDRENLTASIVAHDMMIKFLMAHLMTLLPAGKRQEMVDAVRNMPDLPVPEGMAKSFDAADRLAGVSQKVKSHMQRIAAEAARSVK